jgi:DNA-binding NarL/FixJ family response regulator
MAPEADMSHPLSIGGEAMYRVVLVDDEEPVRALIGITLGLDRHFSVVGEASDGGQAVILVNLQHPDAVVLDLMMPNGGGMEAIPRIREVSPHTKIVVFSALSADQAEDDAMAHGAHAYIEKSKFSTELPDVLQRVCGAPV